MFYIFQGKNKTRINKLGPRSAYRLDSSKKMEDYLVAFEDAVALTNNINMREEANEASD